MQVLGGDQKFSFQTIGNKIKYNSSDFNFSLDNQDVDGLKAIYAKINQLDEETKCEYFALRDEVEGRLMRDKATTNEAKIAAKEIVFYLKKVSSNKAREMAAKNLVIAEGHASQAKPGHPVRLGKADKGNFPLLITEEGGEKILYILYKKKGLIGKGDSSRVSAVGRFNLETKQFTPGDYATRTVRCDFDQVIKANELIGRVHSERVARPAIIISKKYKGWTTDKKSRKASKIDKMEMIVERIRGVNCEKRLERYSNLCLLKRELNNPWAHPLRGYKRAISYFFRDKREQEICLAALEERKNIDEALQLIQIRLDKRPNEIRRIVFYLAQAIVDLHKHGIVHNDLVPSNIMIVTDGKKDMVGLKVIDFEYAQKKDSEKWKDLYLLWKMVEDFEILEPGQNNCLSEAIQKLKEEFEETRKKGRFMNPETTAQNIVDFLEPYMTPLDDLN